ncbi:glycosyltransferase family 2 protein [Nocardioides sp. SYSU DS0663]|uniref:glycosyltransferase family 2 protein n=1 Tax=Nocardioides sp. SYSU DS0663 TaxID=3416445 RepID=UPI003F4B57BD
MNAAAAGGVPADPEVSVVLATYGRPDQLPRALASLAEQTLAPERFEVVVVPNGPTTEVPAVVEEVRRRHPRLRLREVSSPRPGVAHARAVGVAAARGTWMTMLDDDDWLSPAYLERLLAAAAPGVVPLAQIADVAEVGAEPDLANSYAVAFAARRGERVPAEELPEAVSLNVCKLVPTATARAAGFDTRLRSASDTLFWLGVLSRAGWTFDVLDNDDAVYYRLCGHGSLSRQDASIDFSVVRRLEGLRSLAEVPRTRRSLDPVLERTARSLSTHVRRFLLADPARRPEVVAMAEAHGQAHGEASVRWETVNARSATELLLLEETDLSAPGVLAALRGVRQRETVVDVLSARPTGHLRAAADTGPAQPYLGRLLTPPAGEDLLRWALACLDDTTERGAPYGTVRTVPGAPGALAAALAEARPGLRWVAEVDRGTDRATLEGAVELVLPSVEELEGVVAGCSDPATVAGVRARARVEPWEPVPPHLWRGAASVPAGTDVVLHLGDVAPADLPALAAVHALPARTRHGTALVLCSSRPDEVRTAAAALGLADVVRTRELPGLRDGLDLLDRARAVLLDRPAPAHLAREVAAHPGVVHLVAR